MRVEPTSGIAKRAVLCFRWAATPHTAGAVAAIALAAFITSILVLMATIVSPDPASAGTKAKKSKFTTSGFAQTWYQGGRRVTAWRSTSEVAVFLRPGSQPSPRIVSRISEAAGPSNRPLKGSSPFVAFVSADAGDPLSLAKLRSKLKSKFPEVEEVGPVYYSGRGTSSKQALTSEVIVHARKGQSRRDLQVELGKAGLSLARKPLISSRIFLAKARNPESALKAANRLQLAGKVLYAYPNWLRTPAKRALPDDALFSLQWHLRNTGQGGGTAGEDADVVSVWDTLRGSTNEVIAVVDDGLEIAHEDLAANVVAGLGWDYVDGDSDPSPGAGDDHGTAVAGVAAGRGFNAIGVTGSAPRAGLTGHRMLGAATDSNIADSLTRGKNVIDIYSNSWGPPDDVRLEAPDPVVSAALADGATNGRGGKGNVYVWAGGNGGDLGDNANYDGYANSRYVIAVAASDNSGRQSWYSEPGANIMVNAPSNGGTLGITTTDRTGSNGYDAANYTSDFGGTSSAAPLVSGIAALILQANPELSWRDVQHILMSTARKNDPSDPDWTTNGAGLSINHKYGFGRVDAQAAVDAARTWTLASPEVFVSGSASPNLPIPDNNSTGVISKITIPENIGVERVEVVFSSTDHTFWGDLEITLNSPAGTRSVLADEVSGISGGSYNQWRFSSVRHYGETSQGDWTLTVKDLAAVDTGTFQSWSIRIYGSGTDDQAPVGTIWAPSITSTYSRRATTNIYWNQDDPLPSSGLATSDVWYKAGLDGSWTLWKSGTTTTVAPFVGAVGKTYYFRSRPTDRVGHTGTMSPIVYAIFPYDDGSGRYTSGWRWGSGSSLYFGGQRYTSGHGEYMTFRFRGNKVYLITTKSRYRGKANVYVDGRYIRTIDTYSYTTKYRQAVYLAGLSDPNAYHTLKLVNLATRGRPRLSVDGIAVKR